MIPRYSLYLDPNESNGYVREDFLGQWVKWVDIMDYVAYALMHGFKPPVVEEKEPQFRLDMVEDILPEDIEDANDILPLDEGEDIYDLMTESNKHDPIEL